MPKSSKQVEASFTHIGAEELTAQSGRVSGCGVAAPNGQRLARQSVHFLTLLDRSVGAVQGGDGHSCRHHPASDAGCCPAPPSASGGGPIALSATYRSGLFGIRSSAGAGQSDVAVEVIACDRVQGVRLHGRTNSLKS